MMSFYIGKDQRLGANVMEMSAFKLDHSSLESGSFFLSLSLHIELLDL